MSQAQQITNALPDEDPDFGGRVLRKVVWRLIPFLCLLYMLNILDRVNVGFARLTMQEDLKMSNAIFDLGYGIFYAGYLLFEVPSNLLLRRVGARRWMARIMITWGLVSCATLFVNGPISFYVVRILLGVAEAGFFPGIVLYLTFWIPHRERARVMAFFMIASPIAGGLSNPLSGAILQYAEGVGGLTGWQWLFLLEGLPSVLVGFLVFLYLPDGPEDAPWLNFEERNWLVATMRREEMHRAIRHGAHFGRALLDVRVWLLIAVYFTVAVGSNAAGAHFPRLIEARFAEANKLQIGLLGALPSLCAVVAMTLFSMHSDRTRERRGHVALAAFVAGTGWAVYQVTASPWLGMLGLCLAQMGMMSMLPTFWALPTAFLSGTAAAGGIALINSLGNIGGFVGATILGQYGLWAMTAILYGGSILVLCVSRETDASATAH